MLILKVDLTSSFKELLRDSPMTSTSLEMERRGPIFRPSQVSLLWENIQLENRNESREGLQSDDIEPDRNTDEQDANDVLLG